MSSNIVPITLREAPWQSLADEIVIGKDILELLSSSMYVDPMAIYRVYVQNAADAIDEARATGQLGPDEAGKVSISIDAPARASSRRTQSQRIALGLPKAEDDPQIRRRTRFARGSC